MPTDPISITHISLSKNPTPFLSSIDFAFTYEVHQVLTAPLEWKITYVGSAGDESYDQILEEFEINSLELGSSMKFTVECSPPNCEKIPRKELLSIFASILDLTAIIITVAYKQQ
jgi:histone chaperone ASF1